MGARFWSTAGGLTLVFVFLDSAAVFAADEKTGPEEAVFEMREQSVLTPERGHVDRMLTRGQYVQCGTTPFKEVKTYPKLKSKRPLYGKVKFDPDPANRKGIEFFFVLDESGEAESGGQEKKDGKQLEKANEEKAKLPDAADNGTGRSPPSKSLPKFSRYDRLYFDSNGDLDLTNDTVVKPMKTPPWDALPAYSGGGGKTVFDYLSIKFNYGPGIGVKPLRILPWFMASEDDGAMFFVSTVAREGTISIGKHAYTALLAQPYVITGRFDRPYTALYLTPLDPHEQRSYGGFDADMLSTFQRVDAELYTISATPLGDRLKVKPYRGDLGLLQRRGRQEHPGHGLLRLAPLRNRGAGLREGREPAASRRRTSPSMHSRSAITCRPTSRWNTACCGSPIGQLPLRRQAP